MTAGLSVGFDLGGKLEARLERLRLHRREKRFANEPPFPPSVAEKERLVSAFSAIDKNVPAAHSPAELLFVARAILRLGVPGPIVECGTYLGASAAKLSLVAKITGRELYVCDSFRGLPDSLHQESHRRVDGSLREFHPGEYTGSLRQVQESLRTWGEMSVCTFVEGLFKETLPQLHVAPAVVFMDVDYVSSARDCLRCLWPQLRPGGYFFTHEAVFTQFVEGITDGPWWHENFGRCPPPLWGAGYGVDSLAPYLAYFNKGPR
jgi:O-methyltransferase